MGYEPHSITTSWDFLLNFTDKFEAQTVSGGPIRVFQGIQAPSATLPTGKRSAQVKTVTQSTPLTTITKPVYTFTQKKGDATNRSFRFLP